MNRNTSPIRSKDNAPVRQDADDRQTSTRPRPQPGGQRRQHGTHISISDDNHHVTDAISSLYDYGDQQPARLQHGAPQNSHRMMQGRINNPPRPLSFLPSAREEISHAPLSPQEQEERRRAAPAKPLSRAKTFEAGVRNFERPVHHTNRNYVVGRSASAPHEPALSPGLRSPADTATSSFPLNDIDYESSPAAVAQEVSYLQAIRRMSMNVDAAGDPDLPSFGAHGLAPPSNDADEDDASRLFWVPASVHPELAPKEFKTFIDGRVDALKRRSGDLSPPSDSPARAMSGGGLSRKKSMLSRQIDNSEGKGADGYQDGAERLERKRSSSSRDTLNSGMGNLHDLEVIVNDPAKAISQLSMEPNSGGESPLDADMPILPLALGGNGLRRSTRTTYRRGSLREGKRVAPSKRAVGIRGSGPDLEDASETSPSAKNDGPGLGLTRIQTEPPPQMERPAAPTAENFSRPGRKRVGSPPLISPASSFDNILGQAPRPSQDGNDRKSPPPTAVAPPPLPAPPQSSTLTSREPKPFVSQIASNGRTTAKVPAIVETPPPLDIQRAQQAYTPPERSSSHEPVPAQYSQPPPGAAAPPPIPSPPTRSGKRSPGARVAQPNEANQTLQHMASHPSPLPGNSTRTDSLSFIPTLTEDKKADAKKESGRKSGWSTIGSWLSGDDKEKQRRRDEEAREAREPERNRSKPKGLNKPSDSTRLDVLQTTMESSKGRESLVLDRGDVKLDEERKRESHRKTTDTRKEKDGLLGKFGGLFGDNKKKPDREAYAKKATRALSPDPPRPALRPDVDYNWTRFSIIEERAIYRMAHIKLANPRRPLYSQVLLSNFMYSYLAKVQQMHPQMQIPQTAAAKAQQRAQQQQQKRDQPEEFYQYQRYQEQLQEQDRAQQAQAHGQSQGAHDSSGYVEDGQGYTYDQDDVDDDDRPQSRTGQHNGAANGDVSYNQGSGYGYQPQQHSAYQYQRDQFEDPGRAEDDDMW